MFAQGKPSSNVVTFEADTKEEVKQAKKDKKHHKHGKKDKKHHKHGKKDKKELGKKDHHKKHHCCAFVPVCILALIAYHLYQLRNLSKSLVALEALGSNMKGYKKACQQKEAAAVVATAVVVPDEEQISSAPQNIEYQFDEHVDKEEHPVVIQPVNYSINTSSSQMM